MWKLKLLIFMPRLNNFPFFFAFLFLFQHPAMMFSHPPPIYTSNMLYPPNLLPPGASIYRHTPTLPRDAVSIIFILFLLFVWCVPYIPRRRVYKIKPCKWCMWFVIYLLDYIPNNVWSCVSFRHVKRCKNDSLDG